MVVGKHSTVLARAGTIPICQSGVSPRAPGGTQIVVCHTPKCVGQKAGIPQSLPRPQADHPTHLGVPCYDDSELGALKPGAGVHPSPTNSILLLLLGLHLQEGTVTGLHSGVRRVLACNSGPSGSLLRGRSESLRYFSGGFPVPGSCN